MSDLKTKIKGPVSKTSGVNEIMYTFSLTIKFWKKNLFKKILRWAIKVLKHIQQILSSYELLLNGVLFVTTSQQRSTNE